MRPVQLLMLVNEMHAAAMAAFAMRDTRTILAINRDQKGFEATEAAFLEGASRFDRAYVALSNAIIEMEKPTP